MYLYLFHHLHSQSLSHREIFQSYYQILWLNESIYPVYIKQGATHEKILAIVDDISSDGCKIYGVLPTSFKKDAVIQGEIPFPGEAFLFSARVLNIYKFLSQSDAEKTALGCQFIWSNHAQRRKFEKFLYGSNQQFTLSRVTEKDFTPMQKALGLINSKKKGVRKISPTEWAPLVSSAGNALGAIAMQPGQNNGAYTAILNSKPESMLIQHAQIVDGEDSSAVNLKIIDIEESHGFDYSYYICDLKPDSHA